MLTLPRTRNVNPRLGVYFGIYTSLLAALTLVAVMLEQLGVADGLIRALMFAAPVLLFATFGLAAGATDTLDYFAAGRRIPAFFSGLVLAVTALGGVGFVCLTGAVFLIGSDAMALVLGWIAGLVFMAVLLVPYLRKFGAFTLPGYLGARLDSPAVRLASAAILVVPAMLILVAEIRVAAGVAGLLVGQADRVMAFVVTAIAGLAVIGGGMRSLTWTSAAKAIAALLAVAVPVTIVSILISSLPLPQMTHGNLLRNIGRWELARNVSTIIATPMMFDMPGLGLEPLGKRFLQMYGNIGPTAFSLTVLTILAGLAGSPALLARAGTTSSVYEARKSMGWAVLITALTLLTLVAAAVFLRGIVVDQVIGSTGGRLPRWFQSLQQSGLADVTSKTAIVTHDTILFRRDGALFALPLAAGLPAALVYVSLAGALAAALAAIAAGLAALGAMLAEDAFNPASRAASSDTARILTARIATGAVAAAAALIAVVASDPLQLALWGLALSAAAGFPVLALSVLWKRLNAKGALAGMVVGFAATTGLILLTETGALSLAGPLAGAFGMPLAFLAAIVTTRMTAPVGRHTLELVRDMRIPGGETLSDRQLRLQKLKVPSAR